MAWTNQRELRAALLAGLAALGEDGGSVVLTLDGHGAGEHAIVLARRQHGWHAEARSPTAGAWRVFGNAVLARAWLRDQVDALWPEEE